MQKSRVNRDTNQHQLNEKPSTTNAPPTKDEKTSRMGKKMPHSASSPGMVMDASRMEYQAAGMPNYKVADYVLQNYISQCSKLEDEQATLVTDSQG